MAVAVLLAAQAVAPGGTAVSRSPETAAPGFLSETTGTSAPVSLAPVSLPPGFTDSVALGGLTFPTAVRFSPDGRVFVAEKSGLIKVFSSLSATTPTVVADLRGEIDDYWDRGLLGFTLDPGFPASPYAYVLYAYDAPIGGTPPVWNDSCPTPPGPTTDGCVASGRLSRLTISGNVVSGPEQVLINDWCQQYPSHSVGELRFGPDGALYVSGGDGASFGFVDYGQGGGGTGSPTPKNPCGDPPVPVGGTQTAPTAEGGALRSQSLRRPAGEPVLLSGTILRLDPATGAALPDNPLAASANANARRIVGLGFRNPFRFTFRPGTSEVWVGDVGDNTWEEIDRITNPRAATVANAGWPCFEGAPIHGGFNATGLNLCTSLYAAPVGVISPYFAYQHFVPLNASDACASGGASISGLAFYESGTYPAGYDGALFFADHSRNCIWVMPAGANGLPDPSMVQDFVVNAINPVALEIGPGGDLYYVDLEGGTIHRVTFSATNHPPIAEIVTSTTSGNTPLTVNFDGGNSSDPDPGDTLTYSWDLDGNGTFGDAVLSAASWTYTTPAVYTVSLRVTDSHGATSTATTQILAGTSLPVPVIDTPGPSLTWAVGDTVGFSGHATDGQGKPIPAAGLSWKEILYHCPAACHTHVVQTFAGVASGSFVAPDHDYPAYIELQLTATDSAGNTATSSVSVHPKPASLSVATVPAGLSIGVGAATPVVTPFTTTVIANSTTSVTAPATQTDGGVTYTFASWSDGGAASHNVTTPLAGLTLTATYTAGPAITYLSDLTYTVVANGYGPVEKDTSNGEAAAGDGHPITLAGVGYAKGLGAHAASDVRYAANGACTAFSVKVGVDDEVGAGGSVVFQVWADGTKLADSGLLTGSSATKALTADLTGRTTLQLVVTNGGDNADADHADWADARITCGSPPPDGSPPTVTATTPAPGATGVATSARPTATFSEAIDPATVTGTNVTLTASGGAAVAATVAYDGPSRTATLTPSASLATATVYTARVRGGATGIADVAGNRLLADVTWTFTTALDPAVTYLSDLTYTVVANGYGPVEKDTSNGEAAAGDGHPITLAGVGYAKGLGAHAASDVRYAANGACTAFSVKVGVDDEVGAGGSVAFQVWADGTKLADSGVMTGASATQTLSVDLTGRTTLQLVVTNGGDNINADHADWADARITCGSTPPPSTTAYLSDLTYTVVANGYGPVEKDTSNGEAAAGDGHPITLAGVGYAKGLGAHAASDVRYAANGACTAFSVKVGVDDEVGAGGSVAFQVWADGTKLADSGVMTGASATQTLSVDLTGRTTLQLVVTNGGDNINADHADWADARITCGSTPPPSTTAYLSDLTYTVVANGYGPVEKDTSNGEAAAGDGHPITLAGVGYAKGLGAHAASDVRYAANGACTAFSVKVGVDDEVGAGGSVAFQVWADGTKLADSGVMTGASATQTLSVDLTGRTTLQLVVTNGGDNINADHADWADAQITCGP